MNLVGLSKEVADKYRETLSTLTFNNKIVINTLTEIAKEEVKHAAVVTKVIEDRIKKVKADQLLPLMYLMDSICKNIGGPYNELFQQNLVSNFSHVFQAVNEKSMTNSKIKASQVRAMLYKLRQTWGDKYHVFTDHKLYQLDNKIKTIDPAWPVAAPKERANSQTPKILVNPAFVGKGETAEDETERMRAELLQKEKELLALKRKQIDEQIETYKRQMDQNIKAEESKPSSTTSFSSSQSKVFKKDPKSEKSEKESRDPRSRDPRRKRTTDYKEPRSEKKSGTSSPRDPDSSSKSKKDRSPTSKSSQKSDSKKSSSTKSSSSSKSSSKSSSSSKSNNFPKGKDDKEPGKLEKTDSRKRARENDKSPSPSKDGRISPLLQPHQSLGRIPKVKRSGKASKEESPDQQEARRVNKRPSGNLGKVSPIPEKKTKSLFIDTDVTPDSRDAPSPQVGWGVYKEEHPDQFRTPVKEEHNFNWSDESVDHYRGRGGKDRGGRFPRRNQEWDNRGRGGRGVWNQDNKWQNGRGGPNGNIPPFMANSGPQVPMRNFPFNGSAPGLPDWNTATPELIRKEVIPMLVHTTSPEIIRKEVIPMLVQMGEEGKRSGKLNDIEFRNFMEKVALLNETSLTKEQEMRMMKSQEDKENRRQGNWRQDQGAAARPHLLPPPIIEPEAQAMSQGRSPHKNDLPMADAQLLELIEGDPTKSLHIDDIPRTIRFYGETATIVMHDDKVCELSFQPDMEDRKIVINGSIVIFTRVNQGYEEFEIDGEKHEIKVGAPTRELWVDGKWYEFYFQHGAGVRIGNQMQEVFLGGPPPNVKIGEPRPDLCLGRVYAILDNDISSRMPIYLDRKPQLLQISGKPHVIQFVEDFKTLTINGHPFKPEFGGFPMVISVLGKKHFVRLTALPPSINLKTMSLRNGPYVGNPPSLPNSMRVPSPVNPDSQQSGSRERSPRTPEARPVSPYSPKDETSQDGIGLGKDDPLNHLISLFPASNENPPATPGANYNTDPALGEASSSLPPAPPPPVAPPTQSPTVEPKDVNVNKLFASLLEFGLITNKSGPGFSGGIPGISPVVEEKPNVSLPEPPPVLVPPQSITKTPKLKVPNAPVKHIVLKSHHPSLKERQESLLEQLYRADDLQCKSCGVRFSKEEMPQYTSHLDWHFRMKRREKDNAKRAQSRKWYFEKNDWIESDEIEDETSDEKMEEEEKEEEEIVIKTVPVGDGQKNTACPVCREDFDQFYKQSGEGVEEEGWYLHNAMIHEGVVYHPDCFKDLEKNGGCLDGSLDTTADSTMDTSSGAIKEEAPVAEQDQEMKVEPDQVVSEPLSEPQPTEMEVETPLSLKEEPELESETQTEDVAVAKDLPQDIKTEETTDIGVEPSMEVKPETNEEVKEEPKEEIKEEMKEEDAEETEEASSANTSLVGDETHMLAAPVMSQPKVGIKLNINRPIRSVERLESVASQSDSEESEFDTDAIITPKIEEEVLDSQKPRMKGKKFTSWPARQQDKDLSGLCSIM